MEKIALLFISVAVVATVAYAAVWKASAQYEASRSCEIYEAAQEQRASDAGARVQAGIGTPADHDVMEERVRQIDWQLKNGRRECSAAEAIKHHGAPTNRNQNEAKNLDAQMSNLLNRVDNQSMKDLENIGHK